MTNSRNRFEAFSASSTVCAQCGYRFIRGDEAYRVNETGDVIHRECWIDYSDDYVGELCSEVEF